MKLPTPGEILDRLAEVEAGKDPAMAKRVRKRAGKDRVSDLEALRRLMNEDRLAGKHR